MEHRDWEVTFSTLRTGNLAEVNAALHALRGEQLRVPVRPELVELLQVAASALSPARGEVNIVLSMFLFDALMFIPPHLRSQEEGSARPLVEAIASAAPVLRVLRESPDGLVAVWAWHLLTRLPNPDPELATEALALLPGEARGFRRVTLAFAATSTRGGREQARPVLEQLLAGDAEDRRVAAMVLPRVFGDQQHAAATSDATAAALIELAQGPRWEEWEAAPAREQGFFADLAMNLQLAGYARGPETLPALIEVVRRSSPDELEWTLTTLLLVLYHTNPWPADAELGLMNAAQREALAALLTLHRAWAPRPRFYAVLKELGLPLGSAPLAHFLGVAAPPQAIRAISVQDGVVTLDAKLEPHEVVRWLNQEP